MTTGLERENVGPTPSRVKRKVALVVGYVGSDYYGLQMDPNSTLPTIERFIEDGLGRIGCILPTNRNNLGRIGWSRSSRTDKGVHAARLVLSGKLEIDLSWLRSSKLRMPTLVSMLNHELPSDIRAFSATKMNQGFRSRESCHFREYEYLLPINFITASSVNPSGKSWKSLPSNSEEVLESLNESFEQMVGSKSFHNFHKLSPKQLRPSSYGKMTMGKEEEEEEEVEGDNDDEEEVVSHEGGGYQFGNFDPWVKRDRIMASKVQGVIYAFRAYEVRRINNQDFVCIRVRGQAFLLHQIRLMIGCAILIARGVVPISVLKLAILAPYHVNFPMAPAQGLVLVDAGFSRNANGLTVCVHGQPGKDAHSSLMENGEFALSERFKQEKIYSTVGRDFEDGALLSAFIENCERFRVSEEVSLKVWTPLIKQYDDKDRDETVIRTTREAVRITREVKFFCAELLGNDERFKQWSTTSEKASNKGLPHKKLLPNGLATTLTIHFGSLPSSVEVTDTLRALATRMVTASFSSEDQDDLTPQMTNDEIISWMISHGGGLDYWSKQPIHNMIE